MDGVLVVFREEAEGSSLWCCLQRNGFMNMVGVVIVSDVSSRDDVRRNGKAITSTAALALKRNGFNPVLALKRLGVCNVSDCPSGAAAAAATAARVFVFLCTCQGNRHCTARNKRPCHFLVVVVCSCSSSVKFRDGFGDDLFSIGVDKSKVPLDLAIVGRSFTCNDSSKDS